MAVLWKNGAARRVTPGNRVVIVTSDCDERVAIRDSPGEGFASVLMMTEFLGVERIRGLLARPPAPHLLDGQRSHPTTAPHCVQLAFRPCRHIPLRAQSV